MSRPVVTRRLLFLGSLGLLLALGACGDADVVEKESSKASDTRRTEEVPAAKQGAILESGFGQSDVYVWTTALVESKSDHVGQTVTVSFNVKDKSGEVVATASQVEGFSWPGQKLVLGTQVDLEPGVKAASVDATLLIEDDNTFGTEPTVDLGTSEGTVGKDEFGATNAKFKIKNPTDKPLKDLRIGIVCKDKAGKVNGGTSEFPALVPPSGEILLSTLNLIVSGDTKGCTAYIGPGI